MTKELLLKESRRKKKSFSVIRRSGLRHDETQSVCELPPKTEVTLLAAISETAQNREREMLEKPEELAGTQPVFENTKTSSKQPRSKKGLSMNTSLLEFGLLRRRWLIHSSSSELPLAIENNTNANPIATHNHPFHTVSCAHLVVPPSISPTMKSTKTPPTPPSYDSPMIEITEPEMSHNQRRHFSPPDLPHNAISFLRRTTLEIPTDRHNTSQPNFHAIHNTHAKCKTPVELNANRYRTHSDNSLKRTNAQNHSDLNKSELNNSTLNTPPSTPQLLSEPADASPIIHLPISCDELKVTPTEAEQLHISLNSESGDANYFCMIFL
jgi:hypothetical protein